MTARTRTLTPDATTLPSTRSARKAVLLKRPNGTSTKPASVVSLNSIRVMNSCTARMKKATSTTSQAMSNTTIWTKFSKNDEAHQLAGSLQDRLAGIDADLRDPAWLNELIGG